VATATFGLTTQTNCTCGCLLASSCGHLVSAQKATCRPHSALELSKVQSAHLATFPQGQCGNLFVQCQSSGKYFVKGRGGQLAQWTVDTQVTNEWRQNNGLIIELFCNSKGTVGCLKRVLRGILGSSMEKGTGYYRDLAGRRWQEITGIYQGENNRRLLGSIRENMTGEFF